MGVFKLGSMTFGSLFKKPETIQYPFESKPAPEGLKGHISIDVTKCILCGICMRSCSTSCITVDKDNRTWAINPFQCIQCDYCVTQCPKSCLTMEPTYWKPATEKNSNVFEIPEKKKEEAES